MNYYKKNFSTILFNPGEKLTINEIEAGWRCFDEILKEFPISLAVNLSELSSIDSAGIGFLVKIYKKTSQYNIELIFIDMSESLKRLFSITGLLPFFCTSTRSEFETGIRETCSC